MQTNDHHDNLLHILDDESPPETKRFGRHITNAQRQRLATRNDEIRRLLELGTSMTVLAKQFGLARETIRTIKIGKKDHQGKRSSAASGSVVAAELALDAARRNVLLAEATLLEARAAQLRKTARA